MADNTQGELAVRSRAWASTIRQFIFAVAAVASFFALVFARLSEFGGPIVFMILGFVALWVFAAFVADRTVRIAKLRTKSSQFRWINPYAFIAICVACGALAAIHEVMVGYAASNASAWSIIPTILIIIILISSSFVAVERDKRNFYCIIPSILFASSFMYVGGGHFSPIFNFMNSVSLHYVVDANAFLRSIYNNFLVIFLIGFITIAFIISFFRNDGRISKYQSDDQESDRSIGYNTFQGIGHYSDSIFEFCDRVYRSFIESFRLLLSSIFNRNSFIFLVLTVFSILTVYVSISATHMLFEQTVGVRSSLASDHANVVIGLFAMSAWVGLLVLGWKFGTHDDWQRTMAGLIPTILMSLLALWLVSGMLDIAAWWKAGETDAANPLLDTGFIGEFFFFAGIALFVALREERFASGTKKFAGVVVLMSVFGALLILFPLLNSSSQGPIAYTLAARERIKQAVASRPETGPKVAAAAAIEKAPAKSDNLAWLRRKWGFSSECEEILTISFEGERSLNWALGNDITREVIKSVEPGQTVTTESSVFNALNGGHVDWTVQPGTADELKQELFPC